MGLVGCLPRNDKFLFTVTSPEKEREQKRKQELSGIEIEEKIHTVVQQERDKINTELLRKEIEQLQQELEEQEEYVEKLERKLEEVTASKATAKENLGEVFSLALENIVRRNTHLLGGIPLVGQGLAGMVEQDNKRLEQIAQSSPQAIEERKASFRRIMEHEEVNGKPPQSKEDMETLEYFKSLRQAFTETELLQVLQIISTLSYNKESIPSMLELLKEEEDQECEEQSNNSDTNNSDTNKIDDEALREKANQF